MRTIEKVCLGCQQITPKTRRSHDGRDIKDQSLLEDQGPVIKMEQEKTMLDKPNLNVSRNK